MNEAGPVGNNMYLFTIYLKRVRWDGKFQIKYEIRFHGFEPATVAASDHRRIADSPVN